jgi:hypothetical protein
VRAVSPFCLSTWTTGLHPFPLARPLVVEHEPLESLHPNRSGTHMPFGLKYCESDVGLLTCLFQRQSYGQSPELLLFLRTNKLEHCVRKIRGEKKRLQAREKSQNTSLISTSEGPVRPLDVGVVRVLLIHYPASDRHALHARYFPRCYCWTAMHIHILENWEKQRSQMSYRRTSISGTTFSGKKCLSGTIFHAI